MSSISLSAGNTGRQSDNTDQTPAPFNSNSASAPCDRPGPSGARNSGAWLTGWRGQSTSPVTVRAGMVQNAPGSAACPSMRICTPFSSASQSPGAGIGCGKPPSHRRKVAGTGRTAVSGAPLSRIGSSVSGSRKSSMLIRSPLTPEIRAKNPARPAMIRSWSRISTQSPVPRALDASCPVLITIKTPASSAKSWARCCALSRDHRICGTARADWPNRSTR